MRCEHCDDEMTLVTRQEYDYTRAAGLGSAHRVILEDLEGYECPCGFSPIIPNITGLHVTIGIALIRDERPLDGDAVRFLRKTLSLTQAEFSSLFELTPQHYSEWERGVRSVPKTTRLAAATAFLATCIENENAAHVDGDTLKDTLARMVATSRALESGETAEPARINFDSETTPPAWMIHEIDSNDAHVNA